LIKKQTNKTIIKYLIYLLGEFGGVATSGGGPTGPGRGPGGGVGGRAWSSLSLSSYFKK